MFGTFPSMCCLNNIMDSITIRNKEIYSNEWPDLNTEKKSVLKDISLLVPNSNTLAYMKHSGILKKSKFKFLTHIYTQLQPKEWQ